MRIKLKQNTIDPKLKKLEKAFKYSLLNSIGNIGYADILRNFKTKGENIGKPWKPLSFLTLLWKKDKTWKAVSKTQTLLSSTAAAFGLHQKVLTSQGKVELRTNKMVGNVDIAAVHDEGVKPYKVSAKQRAWFAYRGVYLTKGKKLSIPQRKFMEISEAAKREVEDLPSIIMRGI